MKKEIYIIIASLLIIGCSDNNESKVIEEKSQVIKTEQITSNEIKLTNDKEFYNVKKEEFINNETAKATNNLEPREDIKEEQKPEEKSKVVGILKEANAFYVKTKEKLPETADESLKLIKEKTDQGTEFAKDYAKNWLKESWEDSKKRTQEAKMKRLEEEAKK